MTGRVLMTADAVGGIWTYAVDLAAGLASHGVATTLAVLGPPPSSAQAGAALAIPGLRIVKLDAALDWTAETPAELAAAGRAVAGLAVVAGAELVHLNHPALAAEATFLSPVVAVAHSCVATWWRTMRREPLPADFAWRADMTGRGYRRAHAVIAPTAAFATATRAVYGGDLRIAVVPNGRTAPPHRRSATREPFLLAAGRLWDEGKGAGMLDALATRLGVPVIAAGPLAGPNGARVRLERATAAGPLGASHLDRLYRRASAFVAPGRYEPFGLAVLEAAQRGTPLLLADIPTYRELWDGAALFAPPGDADAFADAAGRVLSNGAVALALSRAARARSRRYGADAMVRGTLAVHRALLARPPVETAA